MEKTATAAKLPEKEILRFQSAETSSLINEVEVAEAIEGGYYYFFRGQDISQTNEIKEKLSSNLGQLTLLDSSTHEQKPIIIAHSKEAPESLLAQWEQQTNQSFTPKAPEKEKKAIDLIKMRGHIGNIGQVLMIASGFFDSKNSIEEIHEKAQKVIDTGVGNTLKGKKKPITQKQYDAANVNVNAKGFYGTTDGRAKIRSATLSFFGNGMNSIYGVQRKVDTTRLQYGKQVVNDLLNFSDKSMPDIQQRLTKEKNEYSWLKQNSLKVSNGVKLAGKYFLSLASNDQLKASGFLSMASKIVTLIGLDEDPYDLEKDKGFITRLRRKSNAIAGTMEWIANITLWSGALFVPNENKDKPVVLENKLLNGPFQYFKAIIKPLFDIDKSDFRGKDGIQWFQLLGATAIFGSLTAKSLAPFAVKKVDTEELSMHATMALANGVPEGQHRGELTRLTAQLLNQKELPEYKKQGFAKVYTDIANNLALHHHISIHDEVSNDNRADAQASMQPDKEVAPQAAPGKRAYEAVLANQRPESLAEREITRQSTQPDNPAPAQQM